MTNEEKFKKFHEENPTVYELYVRFGRELMLANHKTLSIALLTERIRWESAVRTTGDQYKVNNNHRAFYVRLLEAEHPEFAGKFNTREQRHE